MVLVDPKVVRRVDLREARWADLVVPKAARWADLVVPKVVRRVARWVDPAARKVVLVGPKAVRWVAPEDLVVRKADRSRAAPKANRLGLRAKPDLLLHFPSVRAKTGLRMQARFLCPYTLSRTTFARSAPLPYDDRYRKIPRTPAA